MVLELGLGLLTEWLNNYHWIADIITNQTCGILTHNTVNFRYLVASACSLTFSLHQAYLWRCFVLIW